MHHLKLFVRLTIFYIVISAAIWVTYTQFPDLQRHLPLGQTVYIGLSRQRVVGEIDAR